MKKILLLFILMIFTTNICFAEKTWYDNEVSKIRQAKNAKTKPINQELRTIKHARKDIYANYNISTKEKTRRLETLNKRENELNLRKSNIEKKYKEDKSKLRRQWRNKKLNSYKTNIKNINKKSKKKNK